MRRCVVCHAPYEGSERFCSLDGGAIVDDAAQDPLVGTTVDGRYLIQRMLGRGGMGAVYLADHVGLDKPVAIKFLTDDDGETALRARFRQEARTASKVEHEHVVRIYDVGSTGERDYIAMEYVDGPDLRSVLAEAALPPDRAIELMRQVLRGLHAIHEVGIIHRDIKPANIVLTRRTPDCAKIMDFGIAKQTRRTTGQSETATGRIVGTPQFMAPEQLADGTVDARADLYAVGVTLYQLLSGTLPFDVTTNELARILHDPPPPIDARVPGLRAELVAVIERALAKHPDDRFADALAFEAALAAVPRTGAGAVVVSRPPGETSGPAPTAQLRTGGSRDDRPTVADAPSARSGERESRVPEPTTVPAAAPRRSRRLVQAIVAVAILGGAAVGLAVRQRSSPSPATQTAGVPRDAAPPPSPPAPVDDPLAIARTAEARGDLALAAAAYETAYRATATPELLYRIGELHERLGDKDKARTAYERYLTAAPGAVDREHVRTRIAQLTPPPAPSAPVPAPPRPRTAPAPTGQICACQGTAEDGYIHQICSTLRKGPPQCQCEDSGVMLCNQKWTSLKNDGSEGEEEAGVRYMQCIDRTRPECTPRAGVELPDTCTAALRPGATPDASCKGYDSNNVEKTAVINCDFCQWGVNRYHGQVGDTCTGYAYDSGKPLKGTMHTCHDAKNR